MKPIEVEKQEKTVFYIKFAFIFTLKKEKNCKNCKKIGKIFIGHRHTLPKIE